MLLRCVWRRTCRARPWPSGPAISESTIKRFETMGQITLEALVLLASSLGGMLLMDRFFLREHPDTGAIE